MGEKKIRKKLLHLKCYEYLLVLMPSLRMAAFSSGNWQQSGSQVFERDLLGQMKENHFLLNAGAVSKALCPRTGPEKGAAPQPLKYP